MDGLPFWTRAILKCCVEQGDNEPKDTAEIAVLQEPLDRTLSQQSNFQNSDTESSDEEGPDYQWFHEIFISDESDPGTPDLSMTRAAIESHVQAAYHINDVMLNQRNSRGRSLSCNNAANLAHVMEHQYSESAANETRHLFFDFQHTRNPDDLVVQLEQLIIQYHSQPKPISLVNILKACRTYCLESRDNFERISRTTDSVLKLFQTDPWHMFWVDDLASHYSHKCVNQAVQGWLEIFGWARMAQTTGQQRLGVITFLFALSQVQTCVNNDRTIPELYRPEAMQILLREMSQKRGERSFEWSCVPRCIVNEDADNEEFQKWRKKSAQIAQELCAELQKQTVTSLHSFVMRTGYHNKWLPAVEPEFVKSVLGPLQEQQHFFTLARDMLEKNLSINEAIEQTPLSKREKFIDFLNKNAGSIQSIELLDATVNQLITQCDAQLTKRAEQSMTLFFEQWPQASHTSVKMTRYT